MRINHYDLLPTVAAEVEKIIPKNAPSFVPVSHVIAARAACSCEHGGRGTFSQEDILNVERSMMLDPMAVLAREFRTVLLGAKPTGADNILTFEPEEPCIPLRFVVPRLDADKDFSNMQAGLESYFASNDAISGAMFGVDAVATMIRPIYTKIGQKITAKMSAAPEGRGHVLVCADMSQEGRLSRAGELRGMGFSVTALAEDANAPIVLEPQKDFRIRKLSLRGLSSDDLQKTVVTEFKVGVETQFLSEDEVTAEVFDCLVPWECWLDGDEACIGQKIRLNFLNYGGDGAVSMKGTLEGDVVR